MQKNPYLHRWGKEASKKILELTKKMTPKDATQGEKIVEISPVIIALRQRGFSWEEIAPVLKSEPIHVNIQPNTLRRLVTAAGKIIETPDNKTG